MSNILNRLKRKRVIATAMALVTAVSFVHSSLGLRASGSGTIYSLDSTGEMVVRIQTRLRELGYLNYKPTGAYRSMTVDAVKAFQLRCNETGDSIDIDGRMGEQTMSILFSKSAPRAKIPDEVHMPRGPIADTLKETGDAVEWSIVSNEMSKGVSYKVIDCNTGKEFNLIFVGGENHAEMELSSVDELENFKYICGSDYNFLKRPVIVMIGGKRVAASIQCFPHGTDTIDENGMEGHVCVFFEGSLSHVGSLPDIEHNSNIYAASGR